MQIIIPKSHPASSDCFLHITWDVFKRVVTSLSRQLPQNATIWGIPRGGELVALQLSYLRPDLQLIRCPLNAEDEKGLEYLVPSHAIIVDDIADTGATLRSAVENNLSTACAFLRETCLDHIQPMYSGIVLRSKAWLIFPWEYEELILPKS